MKRLIGEKDAPQADVYWANEPIHPDLLKTMGISAPYISPKASALPAMFKERNGHWTGFSARARVLVVRSDSSSKPESVLAYTDPHWKGKAVLANPLLNTTTDNIAALFNLWGDAQGRRFLEGMKRNEVMSAPGNPQSAELVAAGKAELSLVDIDDALAVIQKNKSAEMIYPDQGPRGIGVFLVPNALEMIKGARHPDAAHKLIDYILSAESQRKLALSPCAQTPLSRGINVPPTIKRIEDLKVMSVNYSAIRKTAERIRPILKAWSQQ
jgi:iron(III) transport system substrate-binding protein